MCLQPKMISVASTTSQPYERTSSTWYGFALAGSHGPLTNRALPPPRDHTMLASCFLRRPRGDDRLHLRYIGKPAPREPVLSPRRRPVEGPLPRLLPLRISECARPPPGRCSPVTFATGVAGRFVAAAPRRSFARDVLPSATGGRRGRMTAWTIGLFPTTDRRGSREIPRSSYNIDRGPTLVNEALYRLHARRLHPGKTGRSTSGRYLFAEIGGGTSTSFIGWIRSKEH